MKREEIPQPGKKPPKVKFSIIAQPAECSKCSEDNKERWGCGWDDRYRGRQRVKFKHAHERTCPRYWLESDNDIGRIFFDLEDYRRGALGPVGQLPNPLVMYLRIADSEWKRWTEAMENAA